MLAACLGFIQCFQRVRKSIENQWKLGAARGSNQRWEPALDGGAYFIGVCSPDEGSGVVIGLGEEALDGGLEIDERVEHAAFEASLG